MNSKNLPYLVIVVIVIGVGYLAVNKNEPTATAPVITTSDSAPEAVANSVQAPEPNEVTNTETETIDLVSKEIPTLAEEVPKTAATVTGDYKTYSPEAVANSAAEHIILSFSATWCPSCRTLDKDINANLSNIPAGTEIYKVDYDTNVPLRQKYGVTTQHTLVMVDKEGTLIKKWSGSNSLNAVLAKI